MVGVVRLHLWSDGGMASWVLPVRGLERELPPGKPHPWKLQGQPLVIRAMAAATWVLLWVAVAIVGIRPAHADHTQPVRQGRADTCLSAGTIINADAAA